MNKITIAKINKKCELINKINPSLNAKAVNINNLYHFIFDVDKYNELPTTKIAIVSSPGASSYLIEDPSYLNNFIDRVIRELSTSA